MEIKKQEFPQAGFEIYGDGSIGDKASQLLAKIPLLRGIGFWTPQRIALSQGLFDGFFRQNGLGKNITDAGVGEEVQSRIRSASFPDELRPLLGSLAVRFGDIPVMVRSSAVGDSRGTGIYRSEVADPSSPQLFESAVKSVLASYASESASEWRRRSGAGEGMGVLVEPMAGQIHFDEYTPEYRYFSPALSAYGYTSTLRGGSFLYIVPGFGSGVDRTDGDRINKDQLEIYDGDLDELLMGRFDRKAVTTVRADHGFSSAYPRGAAYLLSAPVNGVPGMTETGSVRPVGRLGAELEFGRVFEMLSSLEDKVGQPQYLELALTVEEQVSKFWVLQISDIGRQGLDVYEFGDYGHPLFEANTTFGEGGLRECPKLVFPFRNEDIGKLHEFNKYNDGYLLLFPKHLIRPDFRGLGDRILDFSDFSNAAVMIQRSIHSFIGAHHDSPISHFSGQIETAGILYGVVNERGDVPFDSEEFFGNKTQEFGLDVYDGRGKGIKVVHSPRQDRIVAYKNP
jgi:hypothetical protein